MKKLLPELCYERLSAGGESLIINLNVRLYAYDAGAVVNTEVSVGHRKHHGASRTRDLDVKYHCSAVSVLLDVCDADARGRGGDGEPVWSEERKVKYIQMTSFKR